MREHPLLDHAEEPKSARRFSVAEPFSQGFETPGLIERMQAGRDAILHERSLRGEALGAHHRKGRARSRAGACFTAIQAR